MKNELLKNDNTLSLMLDACVNGGNRAMNMKNKVDSEKKENNSLVTEADREVEQIIRKKLKQNFSYNIFGEEYGGEEKGTHWVN